MFFEGNDLQTCLGEKIQILRALGPGRILVGEFVGLFYTHGSRWVSMLGGTAHKSSCPGTSTSPQFGFENFARWFQCSGEVFQVYAKGKAIGQPIIDQDTISFYYPLETTFLTFNNDRRVSTARCMLDRSAFSRPPTNDAFDQCKYDSVEISILD